MAEYIDREEFIQHIEESDLPDLEKRAVIALVRHMPAADVVEVVHGEWETVPNREFDGFETVIRGEAEMCTHCRRASKDFKKWFAICPNCGAKMDGGKDNATD